MNAVVVVAVAVTGSTALFGLWLWVMNRLDEREESREQERLRREGPPILGGDARHRRRRWPPPT